MPERRREVAPLVSNGLERGRFCAPIVRCLLWVRRLLRSCRPLWFRPDRDMFRRPAPGVPGAGRSLR
ncbi:hypothetical protein GCM10027073_08650 [Streptomyces chlorus]